MTRKPLEETQQWLFGRDAEERWRDECIGVGESVAETSLMKNVAPNTAAPMVLVPSGYLVSADLIVFGRDGVRHDEVKAKAQPGWMRNWSAWTHGIDVSSFEQYEALQEQTCTPFHLVVRERRSPVDPSSCLCDGTSKHSDYCLEPRGLWLVVGLGAARRYGRAAPNWPRPGGVGSRERRGGWCWARNHMVVWDPSIHAGIVARIREQMENSAKQLGLDFADE